jgi:hypothetical protein
MPMQALGAPPPDLPPMSNYSQPQYGPPTPQRGVPGPGGQGPGKTRSKGMDYTLKGLGLLAVAVVSGLAWYLVNNNPPPATRLTMPTPSTSAGIYNFQPYNGRDTLTDCAGHSTARVQAYFKQHPCTSLSRTVYTTTLPDNDRVITCVEVVSMPSAAEARDLNALSKSDGSGHVHDQVEDKVTVVPNGPTDLENGGYASEAKGARVIIAVTEFYAGSEDQAPNLKAQNNTLTNVSKDALRLGDS